MKIPLLDLSASHKALRPKFLKAMTRVLGSETFILGPEVEKLEKAIARYCGVKYAIGVSSGTDALLVSLMALGVGPGDEVITTPYSFFATVGTIARLGARPVFVDIDPATYNMKPEDLEEVITSKTKAILPVHLFGQCADMALILAVAHRYKLFVIEDAAQAIGADYKDGCRAGAMGDVGCFSFFPSKNLGALGDAGMVVTQNPALADKIRTLRVHGSRERYYHKEIGGNFRLDALQAAFISVKLPFLDEWTRARRKNAEVYREFFKDSGLLEGVPPPRVPLGLPEAVYKKDKITHAHIYNQFIIRAPRRDALREHLLRNGIGTAVYYPLPLHLQDCFRSLGYKPGDFPEAERAAQESLALPIYPGLTRRQQEQVVTVLEGFYS
jgi:dTDP-4-amino-4,6-dideoxygalactose transaminase